MAQNRPRGRQRNVTGQGKGIKRRGAGLGTGPVGHTGSSSGHSAGPMTGSTSEYSGGSARRVRSSGSSGGGLSKIIILVLVLLLGGGGGLGSLLSGGMGDLSGSSQDYYDTTQDTYDSYEETENP